MFEGVQKHWQVLRESWALEGERKKRRRIIEEKDFLPAALEVLETPASPIGRGIIWGIAGFFGIALAWALIGHVDVVVSAPGRLIPKDRVKVVQPAEIGIVRAIHVSDGQHVKAGEVLVELDPTISGAEIEQVERALLMVNTDAARARALLSYLDGTGAQLELPDSLEPEAAGMQQRLIDSRVREYEASLGSLESQHNERLADRAVAESELARLRATLPLIEEQVSRRRELVELGLSPRLRFLELLERHVSHQKNIEVRQEQLGKVTAAVATTVHQIEQLKQEFQRTILTDLAEALDEGSLQEQELTKVRRRNVMQRLVAPVDGVVQQLAVHTLGGVVQPAEPILVIVPAQRTLIVEALVLNKDIGFIAVGDEVAVKLEAFPFTKYGTIPGRLENLSLDAIRDENLGLVYQAHVSLERETIRVERREVPLSPGMVATVEIKTGTRRLIEFFLSPLLRYRDESLRER